MGVCGAAPAAEYSSVRTVVLASEPGRVVGAPAQPPPPTAAPDATPGQSLPASGSARGALRNASVLAIVAFVALLSLWHTRTLDERRLTARTTRPGDHVPPLVFLASAFACWAAWQAGGAIAAGNAAAAPPAASRDGAIVVLTAYGVGFVAIAAMLLIARPARAWLGLVPRLRDLVIAPAALAVALPIVLLSTLLGRWLEAWMATRAGRAAPDALAHDALRELFAPDASQGVWWWASVGVIALAAPAFEEFIYRGFLQTSVVRATRALLPAGGERARFGPVWLGIVATSVIFALAHLGAAPWYAMPGLFLFGVALGVVYERTGRIAAPILMHAGFNTINLFLAAMITP